MKGLKKKEFSKKLLIMDYLISVILIAFLIYAIIKNATFMEEMQGGIEYYSYQYPFQVDTIVTLLCTWIGQLGISSAAYYMMCKSDHKTQLPMKMINDMPQDVRDSLDMTQVVTTLLSTTDN